MKHEYKVSVVINTCDRGEYLGDTLEGLKQQTYKNFEVVVVNGPSTDNTEEVAKAYNVRYYTAPYNISVSRNVGIRHAGGDIIAFIDDDAVPEPRWIEDLVQGYMDNPGAGAVGGFVYNHDGSWFQFCYGAIDKWGRPVQAWEKPYEYNTPNAHFYNINIGTNASYSRTDLIEIGGFDEEIEYYHDESDVCVRMINSGKKVIQLDNAFVHHKMAPSSRRNNKKQVTNWDAVVKNSIYFGVKHSSGVSPLYKRLVLPGYREAKKFIAMFRLMMLREYNPGQYIVRNVSLMRAIIRGYWRGFFQQPKLLKNYKYEPNKFHKYITESNNVLDIILVSQGYPPDKTDGISRYNHTLAKELANRGHRIYVVTKSKSNTQIYYRDKHWVYYHDQRQFSGEDTGFSRTDEILALNKSVYATAKGISKKIKVDLVLTPLWDVEGLALIEKKVAPIVVTLMSPLKKVVETQWDWLEDPSLEIVYDLEKYCIENADGVMAISNAIKQTIGDLYSVNWPVIEQSKPVMVIPLGVESSIGDIENKKSDKSKLNILFVGRFEKRKGIDLLLDIVPDILASNKEVEFTLVGNDKVPDKDGKFYFEEFAKKYKKEKWFNRVKQYGYVSDEELAKFYEDCDIFVAPSRYESFGLIFIEAMAHSKPVIGANVGGIPEIIIDNKNGLIFEPANAEDLKSKIDKLISEPHLRVQMGKKSKEILLKKFSAEMMVDNFLEFMQDIISNRQ